MSRIRRALGSETAQLPLSLRPTLRRTVRSRRLRVCYQRELLALLIRNLRSEILSRHPPENARILPSEHYARVRLTQCGFGFLGGVGADAEADGGQVRAVGGEGDDRGVGDVGTAGEVYRGQVEAVGGEGDDRGVGDLGAVVEVDDGQPLSKKDIHILNSHVMFRNRRLFKRTTL